MTATTSMYYLCHRILRVALTHHSRAQDAPHSLGGALAEQFSWLASLLVRFSWEILKVVCRNYDHVASLWRQEEWISESAVAQARAHYAAYSVQRADGLRVITLNTNLCKWHCLTRYMELTRYMWSRVSVCASG